jgi:VanZ family protein
VETIKIVKSISWIPVILLMILIFYFSQQPVTISNDLSMGITEPIIQIIETATPIENVSEDMINHIVRKNAHFFLYFFLGIFVLIGLKKSGVRGTRSVMHALFLSVIFAISDEVHQLFVAGRGASIKDVLIDSMGATIGILIVSIISYVGENRKK